MAFNRLMLTTDGKTLYAKAQQGKPLHFTRVGLGDGLLGNGSLVNRPTMINERLSVPIDAIQMTAGATEAAVIVTLKNAALAEGFSFRELALFAKDPDTQSEKIYLYDHAGNDAEYIPAGSSGIAVYERLKLMIVADSTPNISFDASGNPLYVTAEELDARLLSYQEKLAGAVAKATPEDADKVPILDSADTSKPKLVLWRNIKALFAAAKHGHAIADVANLESSLSNKPNNSEVVNISTDQEINGMKSFNRGAIRVGSPAGIYTVYNYLGQLYRGSGASDIGQMPDPSAFHTIATATPPVEYDLPLTVGFTGSDSKYFKMQDGVVNARLTIESGTLTEGCTLAMFPVGYRPSSTVFLIALIRYYDNSTSVTHAAIGNDGRITIYYVTSGKAILSLSLSGVFVAAG